jgi:hydroxyacylglutathione hydrolase
MFLQQFVDEGLGNSSYLIASEDARLAAVIDAQRDAEKYAQVAEGLGFQLRYALDTHLHADFVSGARELAASHGLQIGVSAGAQAGFEHRPLAEGDTLALGDLTLTVLATPGHTPEHISFTVTEPRQRAPAALFSGGALIVGGAARTDLLGEDQAAPLARQLYHTLHDKLLALPDELRVYPTHGAGSFCSAPSTSDRVTTIRRERLNNRLAQARGEDDFVTLALLGLPSYPLYFKEMRSINQRGPRVLGGLPELSPLSATEVHDYLGQGGAVLDVRPASAFAAGHLPGAYGISTEAPLVTWAGWLIPFGTPLVLVFEGEAERREAVSQLIRIGYDNFRGYLDGGLAAWRRAGLPVEQVRLMEVSELHRKLGQPGAPIVLDVRQDSEWEAGHIPGALHIENGRLPYDNLPLPLDRPIAIHCQHHDRSTAGLSVLARRGYQQLELVEGGFAAWSEAGYEVEPGM